MKAPQRHYSKRLEAVHGDDQSPKHITKNSSQSRQYDAEGVIFLLLMPAVGIVATFWVPLQLPTAIWSIALWFFTGIGITAGYHRLWAHTSYSATLPLRVFLGIAGAAAFQRSIRWWSRGHRIHHKHTDTSRDPYSIDKGIWHAHMGWMIYKPDPADFVRLSVPDLDQDPVVIWQRKYYTSIAIGAGFMMPIAVAGCLWHDWAGGVVYAFILRMFAVHQFTFCVNSLAHSLGDQPFDDRNSPRDHFLTAILTFGEGYHNFHHRFPCDYRNGVKLYHYDPTKWFIWFCKACGLAYDLKMFPAGVIARSRDLSRVQGVRPGDAVHAIPLADLPVITWEDFGNEAQRESDQIMVVVSNIVHDVTNFADYHPGGRLMIRSYRGKDASNYFNGAVHYHSKEARDILATLRVAVIQAEEHLE